LEETNEVLQDENIEVEGRGKADARDIGWLSAKAITRGSGQRKERNGRIKVQQVQPYHGDCFRILQE
jgi:hypothetical protein